MQHRHNFSICFTSPPFLSHPFISKYIGRQFVILTAVEACCGALSVLVGVAICVALATVVARSPLIFLRLCEIQMGQVDVYILPKDSPALNYTLIMELLQQRAPVRLSFPSRGILCQRATGRTIRAGSAAVPALESADLRPPPLLAPRTPSSLPSCSPPPAPAIFFPSHGFFPGCSAHMFAHARGVGT